MITILCAGSRGDFQPYIALAQQIKKHGKEIRIAGPDNFKDFIEGYGIDFYPIDVNMDELDIDPKLLEDAGSSDNPLKMLLTFNKMKEYGSYTNEAYYNACKNSEMIIYHPGCTIGYYAAQHLGIPAVLASPFPIHKTNTNLSVVMYGKSKSTTLNKKISYSLIQGMLWMAGKDSVKAFWKKEFGKLPKKFKAPYEFHDNRNNPALISCSNEIFKRPEDWNPHIHQYGYWFVEEEEDYKPDQGLLNFIEAGEKPVYVGFGSMSMMKKHSIIKDIVIEGIKKSGHRAIISGFKDIENLPENIYSIGSVPHSWLFKHVAAVCHHGGAGTSAAGFNAGVPSIIIPFSNDQFAWAHRSYDLGIGVKPIYIKDLNPDNLSLAINDAFKPDIITKAKTIGESIQLENGAEDCAEIIIDLLNQ